MPRFLIHFITITILLGCQQSPKGEAATIKNKKATTIYVLPLGKTDKQFENNTVTDLKKIFSNVLLLPSENMPASAYYSPRNRYRADTLIHWMSNRANENEIMVGITHHDISTKKGSNTDHGVFGLGFHPGNASMASDYRLKNKSNFFKVVIHELGHNAGLPHCPTKTCFMRDAEGGDPTGEEKEFCQRCKSYLLKNGWNL
ncbi:MAG: hypothetical protein RL115_11 [Bacteroidota bacterium]|jgi:archaemetzincin